MDEIARKVQELIAQQGPRISAVDLRTRKITAVVSGEVKLLFVGRHSSLVYYAKRDNEDGTAPLGAGVIYAAEVATGKSKEVARIARGRIGSISADESLLAGTAAEWKMDRVSFQHAGRIAG
jgi:hypothetical protein